MEKDLELVNFSLTPSMSFELVKFSCLKRELNKLEKLYNLDKNEELLSKINKQKKEIIKCRNNFIKEFRINNHDEIIKYLNVKSKKGQN